MGEPIAEADVYNVLKSHARNCWGCDEDEDGKSHCKWSDYDRFVAPIWMVVSTIQTAAHADEGVGVTNEFKLSSIAIIDCRHVWVYCRDCGRRAGFWDLIKHTKRCRYAESFAALLKNGDGLFDREAPFIVPRKP